MDTKIIACIDGNAETAKCTVIVAPGQDLTKKGKKFLRNCMAGQKEYQCFSEREEERIKAAMDKAGIKYTVERFMQPAAMKTCEGVVYKTKDEIIRHLEKGELPQSLKEKQRESRIAELEAKINKLEARANEERNS